jgi:predicted DNA-binding protein (MmcQ/YjbR family)
MKWFCTPIEFSFVITYSEMRLLTTPLPSMIADILREQYAGVGHRGHLDRRFWISIDLNADVPADEIERLAAQSYELVCAKLTRKQRAELAA